MLCSMWNPGAGPIQPQALHRAGGEFIAGIVRPCGQRLLMAEGIDLHACLHGLYTDVLGAAVTALNTTIRGWCEHMFPVDSDGYVWVWAGWGLGDQGVAVLGVVVGALVGGASGG